MTGNCIAFGLSRSHTIRRMETIVHVPQTIPFAERQKRLATILRALHLWKFAFRVQEFFYQLLRVDLIRYWVAYVRYVFLVVVLRRMRSVEPATGDVGVNTVLHNMKGVKKRLSVNRSSLLLYPLSAMRISRSSSILCVGPRAEGEILNCMGLGFRNVRGLDLISYSPWIDLGDMHAMPYADNAFAVVVMGWCIAYSDNRMKAAREALRVVRNGGIIAVGVEYSAESTEEVSRRVGYQMCDEKKLESVAEILALFGGRVDRVFFSQDLPSHEYRKYDLLVLFSVKK